MPYMPLSIMKALFVESPCRRSIGPCHCVDSVWVATAQRICCTCCCPSKDIRRTRAWGGIGEVGFLRPFSLMDFCILIVPFHTLFILILEFVCVCVSKKNGKRILIFHILVLLQKGHWNRIFSTVFQYVTCYDSKWLSLAWAIHGHENTSNLGVSKRKNS